MSLSVGVNFSQVFVSLNVKIKDAYPKYITQPKLKSNKKKKNSNKINHYMGEKTLHAIHKMWFIYFFVISANMSLKLLYPFLEESIYTKGLNLDLSMLSNISKMFVLEHPSQFKSLKYFLVMHTGTTKCAQFTMQLC